MTALALGLVLASAAMHATWNLVAKRAGAGQPFLFVAYVIGALAYMPFAIAILVVARPQLGWIALAFVAMAVVLQTVYFATLTAGYRAGDLSLVYPIARATGPLLATLGAIAILGERPSLLALGGALAIVAGALVLTGDPRSLRARGAGRAVGYALATGVLIALYTLWDKTAVSLVLIPPLVYDWMTIGGQAVVVAPVALRRRAELRAVWTTQRGPVFFVGIVSRLSYLCMLTALAISAVSYVAPAREIGILFGTLLGARVLSEGRGARRGIGAAAMVAGIVALALG
ncbi:MAG TPA: EamA family transporter [Candidatus Limnocylindria bacterium]|nr:EamA family transporter [Candidatus Limnocylindria bacterium]